MLNHDELHGKADQTIARRKVDEAIENIGDSIKR